MRVLNWSSVSRGGEAVNVACNVRGARWGFDSHGHDFAEIMIVESGSLTHQANGASFAMDKGSAVLIRPGDEHSAKAGADGVGFCNVAFPAEALDHVSERYFGGSRDFWGAGAVPAHLRLGREALERLLYAARALAGQERTRFACERFLMNAIHELAPWMGNGSAPGLAKQAPDWLAAAHEAMLEPENLRHGVKRLFKLAGRYREHVSRSFKAVYGASPEAFVNERRMLLAESLLLTGEAKVPEVALACGMESLSHFHKLFRARFGMSPRRFRVERRSAVI